MISIKKNLMILSSKNMWDLIEEFEISLKIVQDLLLELNQILETKLN